MSSKRSRARLSSFALARRSARYLATWHQKFGSSPPRRMNLKTDSAIVGNFVPRAAGYLALVVAGLAVIAVLVWQAVTAAGNPNPAAPHLGNTTVVVDTGILVLREGLECILVLSAVTASLIGANRAYRAPVAAGAGAGFLASLATWFLVVALIGAVNAPALDVQAVTGLLAILVLLVVMNWFFHKVYWTGWISHHDRRKRRLLAGQSGKSRLYLGLALLGLTTVYREGFEVVLFLQTLRLQAGMTPVVEGVAIGLALTLTVGTLTFVAHRRLPYKKMLIFTGVMLAAVLIVMVGENVQELQQ